MMPSLSPQVQARFTACPYYLYFHVVSIKMSQTVNSKEENGDHIIMQIGMPSGQSESFLQIQNLGILLVFFMLPIIT